MASSEHRYGECRVATQAIFTGDQDSNVRGVTEGAAVNGRAHIAVRVGRVLVYVEDRAALSAWVNAWSDAAALGEQVFPWDDSIAEAQRRERDQIAQTGLMPPE
ncbi:MAG: hypothetical protein JWM93_3992 [Frankiales bacterium]|nr:hypothetical protein [Frankiales bacterium]